MEYKSKKSCSIWTVCPCFMLYICFTVSGLKGQVRLHFFFFLSSLPWTFFSNVFLFSSSVLFSVSFLVNEKVAKLPELDRDWVRGKG